MRYFEIITEARNHTEMFREIQQTFPDIDVSYYLDALKPLRSDIQVWMTRLARVEVLNQIIDGGSEEQAKAAKALRDKYSKGLDFSGMRSASFDTLLKNLNHYKGIPSPEIRKYRFDKQSPSQAMTDLSRMESEFSKNVEGTVRGDHDGEVVARSGNRYWVLLPRGYCPLEAEAMGHCGNSSGNDGDRIISLRGPSPKNKELDDVFLTFILDSEGKLGEMKGRANDKPSPRYHRDIVELLKSPIVKGIKGGGWLAGNNFSLWDLSDDLYREIAHLGHLHGNSNGHKFRMLSNDDPRMETIKEKLRRKVEEDLGMDAEDMGEYVQVEWGDVFHFLERADPSNISYYDVEDEYFLNTYVVRDFIEENGDVAELLSKHLEIEKSHLDNEATDHDSDVYHYVSSAVMNSGYKEAYLRDLYSRIQGDIGVDGATMVRNKKDMHSPVIVKIPYAAIANDDVKYSEPMISEPYLVIRFDEEEAKRKLWSAFGETYEED